MLPPARPTTTRFASDDRCDEDSRVLWLAGFGGAPLSGRGRLISGFSGGKKKSQNKNFDDHITTI
jgi:hypothetical protein